MESDLGSFQQQWQQELLQHSRIREDTTNLVEGTISFLINSFRNMTLDLLPLNPNKIIHISKLPNELIIYILKQLILTGDVNSLENGFALVCKRFFLLSRDISLWRLLCERIYCKNVNNRKELNDLVQICVNAHENDWRRMYIERPRVRLDGIYISTCKYLRPGLEGNTWIQPTYLVTYYRYLRFFSDGSCITLLTSKEPIQVVKNFDKFVHTLKIPKNFMIGHWKLTKKDDFSKKNKLIIWANDCNVPKLNFHLKFDLKSTSLGKFNKLSWIEYYSINKLTSEKTELLKNENNYYFSKVKSYNVKL